MVTATRVSPCSTRPYRITIRSVACNRQDTFICEQTALSSRAYELHRNEVADQICSHLRFYNSPTPSPLPRPDPRGGQSGISEAPHYQPRGVTVLAAAMWFLMLLILGISCLLRPIRAGEDFNGEMSVAEQHELLAELYRFCLERWFDEVQ